MLFFAGCGSECMLRVGLVSLSFLLLVIWWVRGGVSG